MRSSTVLATKVEDMQHVQLDQMALPQAQILYSAGLCVLQEHVQINPA